MDDRMTAEAPASVRGKLRARDLLPRFEIGRISGQALTMSRPGDGWYLAVQWLGWVTMIDLLRATPAVRR